MRLIEIDVTREDIEQGVRGKAYSCPLALASDRALTESWGLAVDRLEVEGGEIRVEATVGDDDDVVLYFPLPDTAAEFIRRFDNGLKVEPTLWELETEDGPNLSVRPAGC